MSKLIIDVREPFEFHSGHIEGAVNIPLSKLANNVAHLFREIPNDIEMVLYCHSGSRAAVAINMLRQAGYTNLINGINQSRVKSDHM
jgi:rhodanese-related sulfurtransferase